MSVLTENREDVVSRKNHLREAMKEIRRGIPQERRKVAQRKASQHLFSILMPYKNVFSYRSTSEEFSTEEINLALLKRGALLLPRVEGKKLRLFRVSAATKYESLEGFGIEEPQLGTCEEVSLETVDFVLTPGVAFDEQFQRVGYGMGFYDRLLHKISPEVPRYGLGFHEQLLEQIPVEDHDIQLDGLFLF